MGYTHYWKIKKTDADLFKEAVELFKDHLADIPSEIVLCDGWGTAGTKPLISDDEISFNGEGELGHETCHIELGYQRFNFCKTARKPYDLAVCVCLLCFKAVYGDDMELESDGDMDTEESWPLAKKIVDYKEEEQEEPEEPKTRHYTLTYSVTIEVDAESEWEAKDMGREDLTQGYFGDFYLEKVSESN